jgi:hypothetical protein
MAPRFREFSDFSKSDTTITRSYKDEPSNCCKRKAIDIGTVLDSALPYVLCPDQLLEMGGGDHLQVFQKAEHPCHLLGHLAGQGIEKILDGAFSVFCPVEDDRSVHGYMLTCMLTYVKGIVIIFSVHPIHAYF